MKGFLVRLTGVAAVAAIAFFAGVSTGRAQAPSIGWGPAVIHVGQMTAADFPPKAANATLAVKVVAVTETGAIQIQDGHVAKHFHANANEAQYIVEGHGMFWLGDKQVPVGPGDLILIPKGTAHGMMTDYKAIAIKSPPQAPDDMHVLP